MTDPVHDVYAYVFDVRLIASGTVIGVGLLLPSERHLSFLAEGGEAARMPILSTSVWDEITAWAVESDRLLPRQPAAMSTRVVAAFLEGHDPSAVIARRYAAIPIEPPFLAPMVEGRLLPELLRARLSDV